MLSTWPTWLKSGFLSIVPYGSGIFVRVFDKTSLNVTIQYQHKPTWRASNIRYLRDITEPLNSLQLQKSDIGLEGAHGLKILPHLILP